MSEEGFLRQLERAVVLGVVGPNGAGKDLMIARLAQRSLARGRPLLSNLTVLDEDGGPHPGATLMTNLGQLLDWDGDVWWSEITTVAGARESSQMPTEVQNRLQQLRKGANGSRLWWSAPSFQRADAIVRECSVTVVLAQGFVKKKDPVQIHGSNRLFVYKAFDVKVLTEWHAKNGTQHAGSEKSRQRPVGRNIYVRGNKSAQHLYRTGESVNVVASNLSGTCLGCGARVTRPSHAPGACPVAA